MVCAAPPSGKQFSLQLGDSTAVVTEVGPPGGSGAHRRRCPVTAPTDHPPRAVDGLRRGVAPLPRRRRGRPHAAQL